MKSRKKKLSRFFVKSLHLIAILKETREEDLIK